MLSTSKKKLTCVDLLRILQTMNSYKARAFYDFFPIKPLKVSSKDSLHNIHSQSHIVTTITSQSNNVFVYSWSLAILTLKQVCEVHRAPFRTSQQLSRSRYTSL